LHAAFDPGLFLSEFSMAKNFDFAPGVQSVGYHTFGSGPMVPFAEFDDGTVVRLSDAEVAGKTGNEIAEIAAARRRFRHRMFVPTVRKHQGADPQITSVEQLLDALQN
jgi:hypothetical protein